MTELLGAEHIRDLQKEISESTNRLSEAIGRLTDGMSDFKRSNDAFVKVQKRYQIVLCILTFLLFLATAGQVYMLYWTSQPERSIELYQALNNWSNSKNK